MYGWKIWLAQQTSQSFSQWNSILLVYSFYLRHHWRKNGFGGDKFLSIYVYGVFLQKILGFSFLFKIFFHFSCNSDSLFPTDYKAKGPREAAAAGRAISYGRDWVSLLALFDKRSRQPGKIYCKSPFALALGLQSGRFFNRHSQPPFLISLSPG